MGLFGGSSSSSQETNIKTTNVGADAGSIAANEGSVVNVLDAGAIKESFAFSSGAFEEAFRFANESLGLVRSTVGVSQQSADATLSAALASKDEAQSGGADRLLKFGALAVAALVAVMYFSRG